MLHAAIDEVARAPFWSAVLEIVFVNLLLSGDNAVVIAMACRALPRRQRLLGLLIGEGVAVVLLIVFAGIMSRLLQLPCVKIAGGLALIYIAARLLLPEEADSLIKPAADLWRAVRILIVADFVMSFDNILAIVQIAHGSLALLAIGLAISIPIVIAGAAIGMVLLECWPILAWAGAVLLGWVGGQTIVEDNVFAGVLLRVAGEQSARVELAGGCAGVIAVIALGTLWRYRRRATGRPTQQR